MVFSSCTCITTVTFVLMKYRPFLLKFCGAVFFLVGLLLFSCSKPGDTDTGASDGLIYYDYYSLSPNYTNPLNDTVETNRVCYDTKTKQVVWNKKNEYNIPFYYPQINNSPFALSYANSFSFSNYLVRIFPATSVAQLGKPIDGIYFQKIDKASGNAVISVQIIGPGEFTTNDVFSISNVVSDGQHLYFACNNGFIYCYDSNGNQVWKKGDYPMANSWVAYGGYALIYLDAGKLYFSALDVSGLFPPGTKLLHCLTASTGQLLWYKFCPDFIYGKQIAFGKDHLAVFDPFGTSMILRKSDGTSIAVNSGSGSGSNMIYPIGMTSDAQMIYSNRSGDIAYIDTAHPLETRYVDIPPVMDYNFIYQNGKIYNVLYSYSESKLTLSCVNPVSGQLWNTTATIITPFFGYGFTHHNYTLKDEKLYILSNYHFENSFIVSNPYGKKMSLAVTIINATTGAVEREYTGLPGGLGNVHRIYNLFVE
jgi:hypothetical protein